MHQPGVVMAPGAIPSTMARFVSEYIDDVLRHVETGMTIADACRAVPSSNVRSVRQFIAANPEWRARFDKALGPSSTDMVRAQIDELMETIAGGLSAAEACKALGLKEKAFQRVCREDEAIRQRYAKAQRKRGGKAVAAKPLRRWRAADFEAALDSIKGYNRPGVKFAIPDTLPSYESLHLRSSRNKEFGRRFQAVMLRYRIATTPMKFATSGDVASFHADLLQNNLYRAAWKRFKGRLPHERDDLIQEFVVRVLAGEMTMADLGDRRHRRKLSVAALGHGVAFRSLSDRDRTVGDGLETLADTVANNTEIFHW